MKYSSFTPNSDISLMTVIAVYIMKMKTNHAAIRISLCTLFVVVFAIFSLLGGISTVLQLLAGVSLGTLFCFLFDILPTIAIPIVSLVATVVFASVSAYLISKKDMKESGMKVLFSSIPLLFSSVLSFIMYRRTKNPKWFEFKLNNKESKDEHSSNDGQPEIELRTQEPEDDEEDEGAVIPEIMSDSEASKTKLMFETDTLENSIMLGLYLLCNFIFSVVDDSFGFGVDISRLSFSGK